MPDPPTEADLPSDAEPDWFLGTAGAIQSCNTVCQTVAIDMCGEGRDLPCPGIPICMRQALEDFWLDQTCATSVAARAQADAPSWTTCAQCSPPDYCATDSCMFCAPGIVSPGTVSYYGTSVSSDDVCANVYLNPQTQPLCPCYLPESPSVLGWTITGILLGLSAVYLCGGVYYGRRSNPPAAGDGAFAHPEGKGLVGWHPHHSGMEQMPGLMVDGWRYFKMLTNLTTKREWEAENYKRGQYKDLEKVNAQLMADGLAGDGVLPPLLAVKGALDEESPPASTRKHKEKKEKKERRKSDGAPKSGGKNEKKKRKPRPSAPEL